MLGWTPFGVGGLAMIVPLCPTNPDFDGGYGTQSNSEWKLLLPEIEA